MVWEHRVEAFNTATESTNRMHDDTVAATYGFRGGLVPGVDVWAYLTRPCVDRWGDEFLERGAIEARFVLPVYDGETVLARLDDDGTLTATGPDGTVRATGSACLADAPPVIDIACAALPDPVPPAEASLLTPGTVLGTLRFTYRADAGADYLIDVRDDAPLYDGRRGRPPGDPRPPGQLRAVEQRGARAVDPREHESPPPGHGARRRRDRGPRCGRRRA